MVVDDDPLARRMLQNLCSQDPRLSLLAVFDNAQEALEFIAYRHIDLLFLDVEMPGLTGLQLIDKLPYLPQVVITTVNKDYAYEAFEHQVTDFLHKPVQSMRFSQAVDRALLFHERLLHYQANRDHIYIKEEGQYIRLSLSDILFFENVGDYVKVAAKTGIYMVHGTLKGVEEKLNDPRFLRVHRSYVINLDQVKDIGDTTLVIERQVIPISRSNRSVLMSRINVL